MADNQPANIIPPDEGFPGPEIPTIYVDGVINLAPSPAVVRFYFFRTEPGVGENNLANYKVKPVAQVVMPTTSFAQMFIFFEAQLERLVKAGLLASGQIETLRKAYRAFAAGRADGDTSSESS